MRIAYLIFHDITKNDGVTKKIKGQVDEWINCDVEVKIFCFLPKFGTSILESNQYEYGNFFKMRFIINYQFQKDVDDYNPDLIYFRYDSWNINLIKAIKYRKSITEINSLDLEEYNLLLKKEKTIKSLLRYLGYLGGRNILLKKVSGFVTVTNEIARHETFSKFKKKMEVVPNGINLDSFRKIKITKIPRDRVSLFFIGTPNQPWHGVDFIESWSKCLPQYDFHIVGIEGKTRSNIFYHGYLEKEKYIEILSNCQICIGSLALFRNKMDEACPLKVREYLAYGFPVILGYDDTSFLNKEVEFILQLKKSQLMDIRKVKDFIESRQNTVVTHQQLRNISTKTIEKKRISFFKSFI